MNVCHVLFHSFFYGFRMEFVESEAKQGEKHFLIIKNNDNLARHCIIALKALDYLAIHAMCFEDSSVCLRLM